MATLKNFQFSVLWFLLFTSTALFNCPAGMAMSTVAAISGNELSCTMCSECEDPCHPVPVLPPPSPPPPPPPSPPPPSPSPPPPLPDCPPPPSPSPPPPLPDCPPPLPPPVPDCPPPPACGGCVDSPVQPQPPSGGGGGDGGSAIGGYPKPAPPNLIVPYFPFNNNGPPSAPSVYQSSAQSKNHPTVSAVIILFNCLLFLRQSFYRS